MTAGIDKACLIVVDMQNDFVRPGAPFEIPDARAITPNISSLLEAFRAAGRPVIHTRYIADESVMRMDGDVPWVAHLKPPTLACKLGHMRLYGDGVEADCADIIAELAPMAGEPVIDKIMYSAFSDTGLEGQLEATSLYIAGVATEVCVDDTARYAVHLGYDTVLISDACASADRTNHRWTMDNFRRNYGRVETTAEVVSMVTQQART